MKHITRKDCEKLMIEFNKYCNTAEQHEFPLLFKIQTMMEYTLAHYDRTSQNELNTMFRVVNKVIGKKEIDNYETN